MHWLRMTRKGVFFSFSLSALTYKREERRGWECGGNKLFRGKCPEDIKRLLFSFARLFIKSLFVWWTRNCIKQKRTLLLKWTFNNLPIKMTFTMFWNFQKKISANVQNYLKITEIRGGLNVFGCGIDLREDTYEAVNTSLQSQEKSKLIWLNVFTAAHAKRIIANVRTKVVFPWYSRGSCKFAYRIKDWGGKKDRVKGFGIVKERIPRKNSQYQTNLKRSNSVAHI